MAKQNIRNVDFSNIPKAISYTYSSSKFKFILDIIVDNCNVKDTYLYFEDLLRNYFNSLVDNKITVINNKGKRNRITIKDIDIKDSFDCICTLDSHTGEVYFFGYFPIEYITHKGLLENNILEISLNNSLQNRYLNCKRKSSILKIKGLKIKNSDLVCNIVNSTKFI